MVTKLHIVPGSKDDQGTLPVSLLDRLGIHGGGDVELVFRRGFLVLRVPGSDHAELDRITDEVMDEFDAALRALS